MTPILDQLWPYLIMIMVGFLPNEVWRGFGLLAVRGIDENSEALVWVRAVATAVLAAVIARLLIFSPGALGEVSLLVRLMAITVGFIGFWLIRHSVLVGVATGVAVLILGASIYG